eukprot:203474_1
MSIKAIQILSRRVSHIGLHKHSQRLFRNNSWKNKIRPFAHHKHRFNNIRLNKRFHGHHHGHHHGHYRFHRFGYALGFGNSLAIVISYTHYQSIIWASIHGALSWVYVIYFAFIGYTEQDKSAAELLHIEVDGLAPEIEKLNEIYKELNLNGKENKLKKKKK